MKSIVCAAPSERAQWSRLARLQRLMNRAIIYPRPLYWQDTVSTGCIVAGVAGVLCSLAYTPALYGTLAAAILFVLIRVVFRRPLSCGWAARLMAELSDYLPANRPAYDRLMHQLAQSEHASPDALRQWLIEERMAIAGVGGFTRAGQATLSGNN
jgi:hypothetical protein